MSKGGMDSAILTDWHSANDGHFLLVAFSNISLKAIVHL